MAIIITLNPLWRHKKQVKAKRFWFEAADLQIEEIQTIIVSFADWLINYCLIIVLK